jgi:hypothetical protein
MYNSNDYNFTINRINGDGNSFFIDFETYSDRNFKDPPIDGKFLFQMQITYNDYISDYFENGKCLIEKMVKDKLFDGTFSINNSINDFTKEIYVTYDSIKNYSSLPKSLPTTLPQNNPNSIKSYNNNFDPNAVRENNNFENFRTYITIENKPYYKGDVITLDCYMYIYSNETALGTAAVKLNYDDKYMMVPSMKSDLFTPIEGENERFIFGPRGITNYTNGVGMVHLGSILFTIKNDLNIDTFLSITGKTISIGGISGTLYCESKYSTSKCSKENINTDYSNYFPDTDDCYFIYYNKYSEE